MKRRFILYGANLMAAVMDAGLGMLMAAGVGLYYDVTMPWWGLLLGATFTLLPDVDLVPSVLWRGTFHFDHRQTLLHRPLFFIPFVTLIAYGIGGQMWALIAFLGLLWHFLHDTNFIDNTYGVAWLWPFSKQFWSPRGFFNPPSDLAHEEWLKQHWLRPTSVSVRELSIGSAAALVAGKLTGTSEVEEAILLAIFALCIATVWIMAARAEMHK